MKKIIRLIRYDWPLHFVLMLTNWMPDNVFILKFRGFLARPFFFNCGKNLRLGRNLTFYNSSKISLGQNIYIAQGNWFSAMAMITIEDEVIFGPKSVITSANHSMINNSYRFGPSIEKPISIRRGSWIAANCTITPGSSIGEAVLISANSVVRGEIPSKIIWGGNPGQILKKYD